jgi:hypothetical protein
MKSFFVLILLGVLAGCSKELAKNTETDSQLSASDTSKLDCSFKGWELYSWKESNSWKFSILPGTNRNKNLNEVLTASLKVKGVDSLKLVLARIPEQEYISWLERAGQESAGKLSIPEVEVVNQIKAYCQSRKLNLYVPNF